VLLKEANRTPASDRYLTPRDRHLTPRVVTPVRRGPSTPAEPGNYIAVQSGGEMDVRGTSSPAKHVIHSAVQSGGEMDAFLPTLEGRVTVKSLTRPVTVSLLQTRTQTRENELESESRGLSQFVAVHSVPPPPPRYTTGVLQMEDSRQSNVPGSELQDSDPPDSARSHGRTVRL
jgi:hypothetical protein